MAGCFAMDTIAGAAFGMQVDSLANPKEPFNIQGLKLLTQTWALPVSSEYSFCLVSPSIPKGCGSSVVDDYASSLLDFVHVCDSFMYLSKLCIYLHMTVHGKKTNTRNKSNIAILKNAHLRMQTWCCFMLKSDLPSRSKITSV